MLAAILLSVATTISSEGLWSFMRQPESGGVEYDTEVTKDYTFGSPNRTNGSHRITHEALSAVETLFEAYYERVFFSSEGLSNNWDAAEFGPQALAATDLKSVSFDGTNGGDRLSFAYQPRERFMPDTRRLVETMTNLPNAYPAVLKDLVEKEQPLLKRGDTWRSDDRKLWWLCSGFQFSSAPYSFDWIDIWPTNFLYCTVPISGFIGGDALGWPCDDRQGQESAMRQWLCGRYNNYIIQRDRDIPRAFGLGDGHDYEDYTYITNSAAEEMALVYGNTNTAIYGEFTRRLVPDEYIESVDVEVETNFVEVLAYMTDEDKRTLEAWEPWLGIQPYYDGRYIEYAYTDERMGITPSRRINIPVSSRQAVWPPYDESFISVTLDESSVPDPDALESINSYAGFYIGAFSYTASNRVVVSGKWENVYDPFVLEGVKLTYKTNSITKGISYLASASRILAAHDRTFEIPYMDSDAEDGLNASNRVETWISTNYFPGVGTETRRFPITVNGRDGTFRLNPPVRLAELNFRNSTTGYRTVTEYEAIGYNYDSAWVSGSSEDDFANVSLNIGHEEGEGVKALYTVTCEDILEPPSGYGSGVFARIISRYDEDADTYVFGFEFDDPSLYQIFPTRIANNVRELATSNITYLSGSWNIRARRQFVVKRSVFPYAGDRRWRKLFPAYAPGPLGKSRVKGISPVFASGIVFDYPESTSKIDTMAVEPPFSYGEIITQHPYHMIPEINYMVSATNGFSGSWDPIETFPRAYATFRGTYVEERIRSKIIPTRMSDVIKLDLHENIDLGSIPEEEQELEYGNIEANVLVQDGEPVYLAFTQVGDRIGCFDFYFYEREVHETDIDFGVLFRLHASAVGHARLTPKVTSKAATGYTSPGIVTDWDWNALKLKHEDRD